MRENETGEVAKKLRPENAVQRRENIRIHVDGSPSEIWDHSESN